MVWTVLKADLIWTAFSMPLIFAVQIGLAFYQRRGFAR